MLTLGEASRNSATENLMGTGTILDMFVPGTEQALDKHIMSELKNKYISAGMVEETGAYIYRRSWAPHSRMEWLRHSCRIRPTWAQTQPSPLSSVSPLAGA